MADKNGPTQARILIVEDESIVALDIRDRLSKFGYDVQAVTSSAEKAIQKVADTQPDLVLMDIRLKGQMDGVEAAEKIRTQFEIPVIYLTAYADKATLERAKITQPFGYILKPFQERELHATVEMALYRHKMESKLKKYRDHLEELVEARTDELRMANQELHQEITERERAEQALRSAHDELEQRVGERTTELASANRLLEGEITERRRVEEELLRRAEELNALNALSQRVSASLSLDEVVEAALEGIAGCVEPDLAMIYMRQGGELHLYGLYPEQVKGQHKIPELKQVGQCLCGLAVQEGRPFYSSNIHTDPLCTLPECKQAEMISFAALPLRTGDCVAGVLGMASTTERDFGQRATFLEALASEIAMGVQNALLYQEVQRHASELEQEVTERVRTEKALRKSEERFRNVFEGSPIGIYQTTPDGRILLANPALMQMLGFSSYEDLEQRNLERNGYRPDYPRSEFKQRIENEGEIMGFESAWVKADGSTLFVRENARLVRGEDGKVLYYEGTVEDITPHKQMEERLQVIYQLGRELTLLHDEREIFDRVLEVAARVLHFERASYGLVDESAGELEYSYHIVAGEGRLESTKLRLPLEGEQGIAVAVVCSGEAIRISDTAGDGRYIPFADGWSGHSELCVPMSVGERVIGVLNIESAEVKQFSSDDQQLLQALADRAAVALENARLYSQLRQRVAELTALYKISEAVTASLDLHETLTVITDHTTRLLDTAAASVALCDEAGQELSFAAASGESSEFVLGKQLTLGHGIVGWVAQHGEPALVPDVSADSRFFADFDQKSGFATHSILCVPLQYKGKTIGAVEAINKRRGPFDQEDLRLLASLAAPAATAIENARLHAETERRAKQLAVLHELDRAITASLRVSDVYHAAARHVGRLLSYDRLSITMIEGEELRVAYLVDDEEGSPPAGIRLPVKASSVGWAVVRGQPLLRHKIAADARFPGDERLLASGIKSEMIIPLRVKGQVIGTWNIGSREKGAYSMDDLEIAQSMADQLAIAIENARLFEQVQAGSERLQTLSRQLVEVQEAERRHIARELHDRAGQALTSLMVGLRLLEQKAEEPDEVIAQVAELRSVTNDVLEDLHQLATELRPASLDHLGLAAALRQHAETFSRRHDLAVEFEAVGIQDERLSLAVETALYRIVQEALTNVIRHAQATRVGVLLERRGDRVLAIVEDDGLGFDFESAMECGRLGLLGMQERAQMVGGTLEIESSVGAGTTLFVEVPYVDTHPDR